MTRSDEEPMAAYVQGNEAAFGELFRRYAPLLPNTLRRHLSSEQDARDLVQQTFLNLHRARHDFDPGSRLRIGAARPWA